MGACPLTVTSVEEEVSKGGEENISDPPPKKVEGGLFIIDSDPAFEEGDIYGNGIYFLYFIVKILLSIELCIYRKNSRGKRKT